MARLGRAAPCGSLLRLTWRLVRLVGLLGGLEAWVMDEVVMDRDWGVLGAVVCRVIDLSLSPAALFQDGRREADRACVVPQAVSMLSVPSFVPSFDAHS